MEWNGMDLTGTGHAIRPARSAAIPSGEVIAEAAAACRYRVWLTAYLARLMRQSGRTQHAESLDRYAMWPVRSGLESRFTA